MENGLSTNASGKSSPNYGDYTSPKVLGRDQTTFFAAYNEMPKAKAYDFTDGKNQEHLNAQDIENSDKNLSAKKRKLRSTDTLISSQHESDSEGQHESDSEGIIKETSSRSELMKQKKAKVSKCGGKEFGSRQHPLEGMPKGKAVPGKEQQGQKQENVGRPEMGSARGKSRPFPPKDKHEAQSWASQAVPAHVKENKAEVPSTDGVAGDLIKIDSHSSIRQATSSCLDASSNRKGGHPTIAVLLKEARDLKHTSNRLKKEGLELESNGLRFEAALKFLYVASLLEAPTFDGAKHGEAMQMYSETAELCEYCAHEYERFNEMAFAALAYKCVEVAYMKGAYCKHLSASKDRNELQATLQIARPGESPSSSASDVDNLNNQGTSEKATSTKCTASPHLVGNHVITARNRPIFMRLLNFSSVVNCAFEATRKAQIAIAASNVNNHGNGGDDGLHLVKRALDFNYNNVDGVVRVIWLALASRKLSMKKMLPP